MIMKSACSIRKKVMPEVEERQWAAAKYLCLVNPKRYYWRRQIDFSNGRIYMELKDRKQKYGHGLYYLYLSPKGMSC